MVDLLHLASVETLTWKPPVPPPPAKPIPAVNPCAVGMVLQWAGLPAKPAPTKQSADYLVAMHELVRQIAQFKTTGDQAPESLLAQLAGEVQQVIQAQNAWRISSQSELPDRIESLAEPEQLPLRQEWQVCAAQWLWWIAQSSHETLRLLEGCPAQVTTAGNTQAGSLRLVVGLTLSRDKRTSPSPLAASAPATTRGLHQPATPPEHLSPAPTPPGPTPPKLLSPLTFDLVTGEAMPSLLADAAQIQIEDSLIGQSVAANSFLQRLTQQVLEAVPTMRPCFEGLSARWLIPSQPWQSGSLKLSFGLAFSPAPLAQVEPNIRSSSNPGLNSSPDYGPDYGSEYGPEYGPDPEGNLPQLSFSQPSWLEQHVSIAVAQQLTQIFLQQSPTSDQPEAVLAQGCAVIEQLQASFTLASRIFAQQSLPLNELAFRLQWGINRTAYEVMQLTSGLAVRLLQPQQPWQIGRLRLAIVLRIRTPNRLWIFDVAQRSVALNPEVNLALDAAALNPTVSDAAAMGAATTGTEAMGAAKMGAATNTAATGEEHPEQTAGLSSNPASSLSSSSASGLDQLPADTLVQTSEHNWSMQPVTLAQLTAAFWQQIEQTAPEIALLRSDTEVMVSTAQSQGELGVLSLEAAFEFLPDS